MLENMYNYMMPLGRPSLYSLPLAKKICERLAEGETLTAICQDDGYPCASLVHQWVLNKPDFMEMYVLSRYIQMQIHTDQIVDMTNDPRLYTDRMANFAVRNKMDALKFKISKTVIRSPVLQGKTLTEQMHAVLAALTAERIPSWFADSLTRQIQATASIIDIDKATQEIDKTQKMLTTFVDNKGEEE